ncbi:hypothetical protein [Andreprevotia sp. IGB-42]|uniref:hypothetical protein n=1 Tax=Andreprevotia sp. IGB-42 TaxID=2497473 RepID=UPI001357F58B|nr:hypothetical protein [Andreprevotia sp. IGB-42]
MNMKNNDAIPAVEIEPVFYLDVHLPKPLSVKQVATLRLIGPGLAALSPAMLLLEWRQLDRIRLGPYYRKYTVEKAKVDLQVAGIYSDIHAE